MDMITALSNYFNAVATDGDWLNDWLTHLPERMQAAVMALGQLLALILGS